MTKQSPNSTSVPCRRSLPLRTLVSGVLAAGLFTLLVSAPADAAVKPAHGTAVNDKSGIEREVFAYFIDFGKGDLDAILTHYADDAVFMPAGLPTVVGKANIRTAYVETLKYVRILPGGKSVADDAFITGEFAWVRTDSRGAVLNPSTGETTAGHFREVFLLRKTAGKWKIWRYMFNMIDQHG